MGNISEMETRNKVAYEILLVSIITIALALFLPMVITDLFFTYRMFEILHPFALLLFIINIALIVYMINRANKGKDIQTFAYITVGISIIPIITIIEFKNNQAGLLSNFGIGFFAYIIGQVLALSSAFVSNQQGSRTSKPQSSFIQQASPTNFSDASNYQYQQPVTTKTKKALDYNPDTANYEDEVPAKPETFCDQCGSGLSMDARFCGVCGTQREV